VLKVNYEGHCVIRNRIHESVSKDAAASQMNRTNSEPTKELTMDKPDPYADLKDNLNTGNVVAFVGAGLSSGAGLPGWYSLITELAQRIGYELPPAQWATGEALIDAAQAYITEQGLHSLVMFLKDQLDTTDKSPTAAHQALARLPIPLVLTANYDDLLEWAYRDAGKRVQVVVRDSDIPFMRRESDAVNIVKLYGDLDQPDTIVLARQQYEAFFLQRPQMIKLLETELGRSDVLYLGWSHSDPHFNLIFGELLNRFGQFMRAGYAVMFDLPKARRKELERKHIRLVQLPAHGDRTGQLAAWLNSLIPGDAAQQLRRTQAPRTDLEEGKMPQGDSSEGMRSRYVHTVKNVSAEVAAAAFDAFGRDLAPDTGIRFKRKRDIPALVEYTILTVDIDQRSNLILGESDRGTVRFQTLPSDTLEVSIEVLPTFPRGWRIPFVTDEMVLNFFNSFVDQLRGLEPSPLVAADSGGPAQPPTIVQPTHMDSPPASEELFPVDEERALLLQELAQHKRNLYKLREKKANYGIDVPLSVVNQIEDEEREIARVQAELESLGENSSGAHPPAT